MADHERELRDLERRVASLSDEFHELRQGMQRALLIAEQDPEMALTRARKVLEQIVREIFLERCAEDPGTRPLENLIQRLVKDGYMPTVVEAYATTVRKLGNVGTHAFGESISREDVARSLAQLLPILDWYFTMRKPPSPLGAPGAVAAGVAASPLARAPRRLGGVVLAVGALAVAFVGGVLVVRGRSSATAAASVPGGIVSASQAASASAATPASAAIPSAAIPGMTRIEGRTLLMGIAPDGVERALERCRTELAVDPKHCTAEKLAREAQRSVTVGDFFLDDTEVTNGRFAAWVDTQLAARAAKLDSSKGIVRSDAGVELATVGTQRGGLDATETGVRVRDGFDALPAVMVTWFGASAYCAASSKRLPTEPEWELAARGGDAREFPWGDALPTCAGVAFAGRTGMPCGTERPSAVGTRPMDVGPLGTRDLGGNVAEWTADEDATLAKGSRAVRGGSWFGSAFESRTTRRGFARPEKVEPDIGFRCAKDVPLTGGRHE
jgi:formylglycine-generating enzyme required for sulfatase activity